MYFAEENLKYDLIVHPNANASDIQLQYQGVNPVLKDNNLSKSYWT